MAECFFLGMARGAIVSDDFSDGNDGLVTWFGHVTRVQIADPPMGVLFLLALSSIAVYGIMIAGWSSGSNKAEPAEALNVSAAP